ncbi:hypothetical protein [Mesorhizobium sp.]|uniref:hypothetical protein n=1 Tax=Mesorhizobium sp. TaxID=1871066 RepID=UPI000FE89DB0|nr:hypothetical protein [Mesorhizobium sp.]RWO55396.1 MAG: hypothetical protein EOS14_30125 [Mesorhizobium sp.]
MTTGGGRQWSAREPRGFWRSFPDVDLGDDAAKAGWVQRYGDPLGELAPHQPIGTALWKNIATVLALFREGWREPDHDGISHARENVSLRADADLFMRGIDARPTIEPNLRLALRCTHLHDYMTLSAAIMLGNKTPMRRCDQCGHWYGFQRRTGRFCSGECRSAAARIRKDQVHVVSA